MTTRYFLFLVLLATAGVLVGFSWPDADHSLARANKVQGLYVFTDCQPASEYQTLGDVKFAGTVRMGSSQYEDIRDKLIKRAKSEYPEGEGVVLYLQSGGTDHAEVIKFKR